MNKRFLVMIFALVAACAEASWYWPFGDEDDATPAARGTRVSELMEPASLLIDEASDLASEGKMTEAVEKYRAALKELDRVAEENPDRIDLPEFATIKTKRAYIDAAIDSMLLKQVKDNARRIAVSDTRELEKKLAEEENPKPKKIEKKVEGKVAEKKVERKKPTTKKAKTKKAVPTGELTKKEQVMRAIGEKDFATADRLIAELLTETPNGAAALNLRAVKEAAEGKYREAERTLDQAIQSNPRHAASYYNMAVLFLQTRPEDKAAARRYYETSRAFGGSVDAELEEALK